MGQKRVILVTGGCRSGKSRFALEYANRHYQKKIYLATCEPLDEEMAHRIELHKRARGPEWQTVEEPIGVVEKVTQHGEEGGVILLDCLTLWISNLLMRGNDENRIMDEIARLVQAVQRSPSSFLLVSNEVGMGIVPADPTARFFRDIAGMVNQTMAREADTVILMISGIPMGLKGGE